MLSAEDEVDAFSSPSRILRRDFWLTVNNSALLALSEQGGHLLCHQSLIEMQRYSENFLSYRQFAESTDHTTSDRQKHTTLTQLFRFNNHVTPQYIVSIFQDKSNQTNNSLTWSELKKDILFQCDKCLSAHIALADKDKSRCVKACSPVLTFSFSGYLSLNMRLITIKTLILKYSNSN